MSAATSTLETADRFHSAAIHALRHVRREDPATGLSAARLSALSVLVFGGPTTLGELAAAEQVKPPTMTRIVRALEEDGLVTSEWDDSLPGPAKRTYELTDAGRRVLEQWTEALARARDEISEFLTRYEQERR
jgi:DNA-binding MarR family transcriptional regulator